MHVFNGSVSCKRTTAFRVLLTITLLVGTLLKPSSPVSAQKVYANSQDNGVTGLCLACSVSNPNNPVNNANLTDYSTFNITIGLGGVSVYQDLIFPSVNADPGCDSIVVNLGGNAAILSAALLNGVTLESYDGSTPNGDVTNVTVSNFSIFGSDSSQGLTFFVPTKPFDRVRVTLNSSVAGVLSGLRLYYAFTDKTILTAPTLSGGDTVTLCGGGTAVLTASPNNTSATVNWYTQATGGSSVFTGSTFSVTPANTTTYYAESDLGSCSSPARTAVEVVVNPRPATPALVNAADTVCSGNPATFTILSPQAGTTYNWYTVDTGGTPIAAGTSFTVPSATNSQNYFVEADAASSGCASASRTTAALTVNPTPYSTTISGPDTLTVSQGQTATFSVNTPNPAYTYNWYDAPSGGNLVGTGSTFTTPAIFAPTSYYVSALSNQGCTSPSRTRVVVIVLTPDSISCGLATTQQSPIISGVCLGCTVSNGPLAVDGDPSTASTISTTLGATGSVGQLLGFPNTYPAGDSIIVDLDIPGGNLSTTLLGGIQVQTYLNGTANNDAQTLNDTAIRLQLLGSDSSGRFRIIIPTQYTFNAVLISMSGDVSLLSTLEVFDAAALVPRPTAASTLIDNCGPASDTLKATGPAGATFNWYPTASGGTTLATGTTYVTPVLSSNTTYYLESSQFGCANAVRTPVMVDITTPPAPPTLGAPSVTICSGDSATLSASTPPGVTVRWYTQSTGGTPVDSGSAFTTPALTDSTIYYAGTAANGCLSTTLVPDSVNVNQTPQPATVNPVATTISQGQTATLTASSATPGAIFDWYAQATGGSPIFSGATFMVSPSVTTTYYVSAVNPATGCTAARTPVTVTVLSGGGPAVPCGSATSDTTSINGVCVGCSVANDKLAVDDNANTGSTLDVTLGALGGNVQQTLIFPFVADAGDSIYIKVVATGQTLSLPVLSSVELETFDGSTSNNDLHSVNSALVKVSVLSGGDSAIIAYAPSSPYDRVVVELNAGTAGALTQINIDYASSSKPPPVLQSDTVSICSGGQATLKAIAPPNATFNWYTAPAGGTPVFTGATFQTPVLTDTTLYYAQSTATIDGCVNSQRTPALVIVSPAPGAPTVKSGIVTICAGGQASLIATGPAGATFEWFSTPTGGAPVFTGDTLLTPVLNSPTGYYVESENPGGCGASSTRTYDSVAIVLRPATPSLTAANVSVCDGNTATLQVQSPQAGINYQWYSSPTAATPVFTGTLYSIPGDTASADYYVSASTSGGCSSTGQALGTVTVNPVPGNPMVQTPSVTICSNNTATFAVTNPTPGITYSWYATSGGGTPLTTGSSFTSPVLTSSTNYYVGATSASACSSPGLTMVSATVSNNLTPPQLVASQVPACNGQPATFIISNPLGGATYNWYTDPTGGSLVNTGTTYTINNPLQGDTFYVSTTASGGTCTSATRTEAILTISPAPAAPTLVSGAAQVCAGGNTSLQISNPVSGETYTWFASASGGFAVNTGTIFNLNDVTAATTYYVEATDNGCSSASRTLVTVNIEAAASDPTVTASDTAVCPGDMANLLASSVTAGATYNWYAADTGGSPIAAGPAFTSGPLTSDTTFYVSATTPLGCPSTDRVPITIGQFNPLAAPTVTVLNRTPTSVTFEWTAVPGAVAYKVSLDSGATFGDPTSGPTGTTETINGLLPNVSVSLEVEALGAASCQNSTASALASGVSGNPLGDYIFVPNVFSPNGDGVNDILYVYSTSIASMVFRIYNQWGQEVFESRDINIGWDGTMGGQKQPVGVYIYVLQATMQDGTIVNKKGSVSLIR